MAIVAMEHEEELVCDLSSVPFSVFTDLESSLTQISKARNLFVKI